MPHHIQPQFLVRSELEHIEFIEQIFLLGETTITANRLPIEMAIWTICTIATATKKKGHIWMKWRKITIKTYTCTHIHIGWNHKGAATSLS